MSLLISRYLEQQKALRESQPLTFSTQPLHPAIWTTVTLALVYRAYSHGSLTIPGIIVATITAVVHGLHPSPVPFILLVLFFLLGTTATRIKQDVKSTLTLSSTGHGSGATTAPLNRSKDHVSAPEVVKVALPRPKHEASAHPRSAVQVLANSGCATLLCLLQLYVNQNVPTPVTGTRGLGCFGHSKLTPTTQQLTNIILAGIIANYAAVTADTLSSELGILSPFRPRLITSMKEVPPGTNGGITSIGLFAGLGGALLVGAVSVALLPICNRSGFLAIMQGEGAQGDTDKVGLVLSIGAWGALGSVVDSLLGALLQASVIDRRSGKIVEAPGGGKVKVVAKHESDGGTGKPSREIASGRDWLTNNQINYLMASIMSVGAMFIAGYFWKVPTRNMRAGIGWDSFSVTRL